MNRIAVATILLFGLTFAGLAAKQRYDSVFDERHTQTAGIIMARIIAEHARAVDQKRASPNLAETDGERYVANWLYSLRYLKTMRVNINQVPFVFRADELLFDMRYFPWADGALGSTPWRRLRAVHYDQLPRPLLEVILRSQMEQHSRYTQPESWPGIVLSDWERLPAPVRKIAAYRMAWEWAGRRNPERFGITRPEAARILVSVGIVESLFDLDKIDNSNPRTGNVDRGYLQISDLVRRDLECVPEFEAYRPEDYYLPWVSIEAGSYHLFERLMKRSEGDIRRAIGMYNAGPAGSPGQAAGYFFAVMDRYSDTFIRRDDYSPTRYLMLQYAEADYFKSVESDVLFGYLRGHEDDRRNNPTFSGALQQRPDSVGRSYAISSPEVPPVLSRAAPSIRSGERTEIL